MNKGYFLDKWFRISDSLQAQMAYIFVRNNVKPLRLSDLPEHDRVLWEQLHHKSNRVADKICKIILEKP